MNKSLKYVPEFDGVRGIAALMVMIFHFFQNELQNGNSQLSKLVKLSAFGQTGVTLFFVLSGFLITRILLRSKNEEDYFKTFYIRRSLRIFPLYFLYLAIYYFILPFFNLKTSVPFSEQWTYWVYLQNFAITFNWNAAGPFHFWSLAVEEHFYLFWPVAAYFFSTKSLKIFIYLLIALALVLRFILFTKGYEVFYFTFTNVDSLALGGLLALQEIGSESHLKKRNFLLLFIVSLIISLFCWIAFSAKGLALVQCFKSLLISVMYYAALGFVFTSTSTSFLNRFLRNKGLKLSGKISYGLYVYHPLCFSILSLYTPFNYLFLNFWLAFCASFAIALISYYAFEIHFLKLKDYFQYRESRIAVTKS